MSRAALLLAAAALAALGCERRAPPDPRAVVGRALRGVLVYPLSREVALTAGEDAGQVTLVSADSTARVAAWFRRELGLNGWELQSDHRETDGTVTLYADSGRRPLWITLRPNRGAPGTTYTVTGAIVAGDSAARDSSRR